MKNNISKSAYMLGLNCSKALWLSKNAPKSNTNKSTSQIQVGNMVGELARDLFAGGVLVDFGAGGDFGKMLAKTTELLQSETIIYEATFSGGGTFAMLDILVKNGDKWDIYEVKSSTSVKSNYIIDSAYQRYAAQKHLKIGKNYLVYINNEYVFKDNLEIDKLFKTQDITDLVLVELKNIKPNLENLLSVLSGDIPDIEINASCFGCDFKPNCWQDIPPNSVFDLHNLRSKKKFDFYQQGKITYQELKGEKLNPIQKIQIQQKEVINSEVIQKFMDKVKYPINFFDFETFQNAVPKFAGQRAYMQMPFQYSLHILDKNQSLKHYEFLADCNQDPREELAKNMLKHLSKTGSIMAYNQSFEISRIKELAEFLPKYKEELLNLIPRFVDLIIPFKSLGYYHPDFHGSFSIKSVLPAMFKGDKELDYKSLGCVQNGDDAMNIFANLHLETDQEKVQKIREDLLKYCQLDTFAMVKIWQKLNKI